MIEALESRLGYRFVDRDLLLQALTHRSWAVERGGLDYERLEFLGDAILQASITAELMVRFPALHEGALTALRQQFVRETALATIGRAIGLGPVLRLGIGEDQSGGREKPKVLADVVEALLGAIFLDSGFEPARAVVAVWMADHPFVLGSESLLDNPRGRLQELTQGRWKLRPDYLVAHLDGPAHAPVFVAEVRVAETAVARARGPSKSEAMQRAAQIAVLRLEPVDTAQAIPSCDDEPRLPWNPLIEEVSEPAIDASESPDSA